MPEAEPTPLSFVPFLRPQIWGGQRLAQYGKPLQPQDRIGESWELSLHPFHLSRVASPTAEAGRTFQEVWHKEPSRFLGRPAEKTVPFPLLVKMLDCVNWLSIQVHPNDTQARKHAAQQAQASPDAEPVFGKSEAWYVLHAEPDAEMLVGLSPGVTAADIRSLQPDHTTGNGRKDEARQRRIDQMFVRERPQAGQFLFIPPGTVHAARGILVWEFQTPSDLTYRVFDWDRLGPQGKPRELHLDLAIDAIDWSAPRANIHPAPAELRSGKSSVSTLMQAPFQVEHVHLGRDGFDLAAGPMRVLSACRGDLELRWSPGMPADLLQPGSLRLLPAGLTGRITSSGSAETDFLIVTPGELA